jgi:hypothetical protein
VAGWETFQRLCAGPDCVRAPRSNQTLRLFATPARAHAQRLIEHRTDRPRQGTGSKSLAKPLHPSLDTFLLAPAPDTMPVVLRRLAAEDFNAGAGTCRPDGGGCPPRSTAATTLPSLRDRDLQGTCSFWRSSRASGQCQRRGSRVRKGRFGPFCHNQQLLSRMACTALPTAQLLAFQQPRDAPPAQSASRRSTAAQTTTSWSPRVSVEP